LGGSPNTAEGEFSKQRPRVDLLEEAGAQNIGNLEDCGEHALGQRIQVSVFIGG
jgi:hypothetical protein